MYPECTCTYFSCQSCGAAFSIEPAKIVIWCYDAKLRTELIYVYLSLKFNLSSVSLKHIVKAIISYKIQ